MTIVAPAMRGLAHRLGHGEAVHARHAHVEQHHFVGLRRDRGVFDAGQRGRSAVDGDRPDARSRFDISSRTRRGVVVVDDEDLVARQRHRRGFVARCAPRRDGEAGGEMKRAALPGVLLITPGRRSSRPGAGDGQAEPGAAVAPRRRHVVLLERREQRLDLGRRDADAGVADGEVRATCPSIRARPLTSTPTSPRSANLMPSPIRFSSTAQAQRVADEALRRPRLDPGGRLRAAARPRPASGWRRPRPRRGRTRRLRAAAVADFELRDVEDVVDHAEQAVRARASVDQGRAAAASAMRRRAVRHPETPFIGVRISWLMLARTRSWRGRRPRRRGARRPSSRLERVTDRR